MVIEMECKDGSIVWHEARMLVKRPGLSDTYPPKIEYETVNGSAVEIAMNRMELVAVYDAGKTLYMWKK